MLNSEDQSATMEWKLPARVTLGLNSDYKYGKIVLLHYI